MRTAPLDHASGSGRPLPRPGRRAQLGHMRRLLSDPVPELDLLRDRYGPMVGLGVGPMKMAVIGDPNAVGDVFALPNDRFRWNHKFNILGFVVGPGSMIVSDGDDHHRRRKAVAPGFGRRRLNGWMPMIVEQTDAAVDRMSLPVVAVGAPAAAAERNLGPVVRDLVLRIVVRAMFGESMAARSTEIGALFERSQAYLESSFVHQLPHPFPRTTRARVRADRKRLDEIIDAEIALRRAGEVDDERDVLGAIVASGDLDDGEIRDQVATLIGAGFDTTSASLSWMLWRAVLTPVVWERLRAEADEVLGPPGGVVEEDPMLLARLPYADRVMRESLRLHPAGVAGVREAAADVCVGGYRIPRGTLILWSPYLVGRDESAWTDPLRFDPDRFEAPTPEQRAATAHTWIPFGGGARNCVGFALAQMELTIIISRLAQRLDLEAATASVPEPFGLVVNRPVGGVPMRVRLRPSQG